MANRNPTNQFKKGVTGNKNGRPKKGETLKEVFEEYGNRKNQQIPNKTNNEFLVERLYQMAATDVTAAKYIFDRLLGKPKETLDQTMTIEMPKVIEFTDDYQEIEAEYEISGNENE